MIEQKHSGPDVLGVVHLTPTVGRMSMGWGAVVLNLARVQIHQGWDSRIWCLDTEEGVLGQSERQGFPMERILRFQPWGPRFLGYSPKLMRAAKQDSYADDTILHQHGIWTAISVAARRWAHGRRPTIVAPHGSLEAWAMRKSRWKKVLASLAYEKGNLRNASCLHALSMAEAEAFRGLGLRNPIAVVPNGISTSWISSSGNADAFRERHKIPSEKRLLLFLSRVTPKKGLPMFVECMRNTGKKLADWEFVIAGPNEFHHQEEIEGLLSKYGLTNSVRFVGPLFGAEKRGAFAAADVFVLPSHSEGWPISVLEALGAGVPVLTTVATPFPELVEVGAGWRVEAGVEPLTTALLDAVDTSRSALAEMGARGRQLVASRMSWDAVTAQLSMVYRWLMGRGPRPDSVIPAL